MPHSPITTRMLNTADPTIVPTPTSPFVINTPEKKHQKLNQHIRSLIFGKWYKMLKNNGELNKGVISTQFLHPSLFYKFWSQATIFFYRSKLDKPKYDDDAKIWCWRQSPVVGAKVRWFSVLHIILCMKTNSWTDHWPIIAVHSSGAELPAAIKVAPATSSLSPSFWLKRERKKLQFIATPDNFYHNISVNDISVNDSG